MMKTKLYRTWFHEFAWIKKCVENGSMIHLGIMRWFGARKDNVSSFPGEQCSEWVTLYKGEDPYMGEEVGRNGQLS